MQSIIYQTSYGSPLHKLNDRGKYLWYFAPSYGALTTMKQQPNYKIFTVTHNTFRSCRVSSTLCGQSALFIYKLCINLGLENPIRSLVSYRTVATCLLSRSKFTVAVMWDFLFPSMLVSLTEKIPINPNTRLKFNQVFHLAR